MLLSHRQGDDRAAAKKRAMRLKRTRLVAAGLAKRFVGHLFPAHLTVIRERRGARTVQGAHPRPAGRTLPEGSEVRALGLAGAQAERSRELLVDLPHLARGVGPVEAQHVLAGLGHEAVARSAKRSAGVAAGDHRNAA